MSEAAKNKFRLKPYLKPNNIILDIGSDDDPILDRSDPNLVTLDHNHPLADLKCGACSIPMPDEHFDIVHASHILEDIENPMLALKEWMRVLKHRGYLILYMPHKAYYPNVGTFHANKAHKYDYYPHEIEIMLFELGMKIIKSETFPPPYGLYDYNRRSSIEYSFLIVAEK